MFDSTISMLCYKVTANVVFFKNCHSFLADVPLPIGHQRENILSSTSYLTRHSLSAFLFFDLLISTEGLGVKGGKVKLSIRNSCVLGNTGETGYELTWAGLE